MNRLLQHQHNVCQHEMNKTKYEKYEAGLTALHSLVTSNIKESFVLAHNNRITEFRLFDPIFLMENIQTNYVTVLPRQLQENEIALDAQWDLTIPIAVLLTHVEYCKLSAKAREEPPNEKNIL